MSLISEQFLVFAAVLVLAFYLVPKRLQWVLLLLASCVFYAAFSCLCRFIKNYIRFIFV